MLRLSTFTISHFSEKARWALDWSGLSYTDRRLVPGTHAVFVRAIASKTTVPVLEDDGLVVQGSSAILDHLERSRGFTTLAPEPEARDQVVALEALVDEAFGLGTQRIFYASLLDEDPDEVIRMWSQSGPFWGRTFLRVAFPLMKKGVRRAYRAFPDAIDGAKDLFRRAFDETDALLAASPYLYGERPSRADVTVAALLAPLCQPPEHELEWPSVSPGPLAEFMNEFVDRPTFRHVLRMYREHRRRAE